MLLYIDTTCPTEMHGIKKATNSLKASDAVYDDNVYDEVDMKYESTRKKKETEFVDSAHYTVIAEGHLTK